MSKILRLTRGDRLFLEVLLPYFPWYALACFASISLPFSKIFSSSTLKYCIEGYNFFFVLILPATPVLVDSPLPMSKVFLFLLATSYAPLMFPSFLRLSLVNLDHFFCIGILSSFMKTTLQVCYNISTLAVGRFELPRQITASELQSCHVCQFQHTAITENWGECSRQVATPPQRSKFNFNTVVDFVKDKKISIALFFPINLCGGNYAYMP